MIKLISVLVLALIVEAVGVVFLSRGLKELGPVDRVSVASLWNLVSRGVTHPDILLGVALEAMFFGALLYLLSGHNVSLIWPLTSLGFVITTLAARFILHEQVTTARWVGVALIVIGAAFVSYGEKAPQATAATDSKGSLSP